MPVIPAPTISASTSTELIPGASADAGSSAAAQAETDVIRTSFSRKVSNVDPCSPDMWNSPRNRIMCPRAGAARPDDPDDLARRADAGEPCPIELREDRLRNNTLMTFCLVL